MVKVGDSMKKYISILVVMILACLCLTGCKLSMTEEERAAYIASHTYEYKVVSAYQYMKPVTNNFGGVIRYESKYCFTYVDGNGQLHEFEDFEHTNYGLWKVCIGNENKYVVQDSGIDTYRWLYLTEETFNSINTTAK